MKHHNFVPLAFFAVVASLGLMFQLEKHPPKRVTSWKGHNWQIPASQGLRAPASGETCQAVKPTAADLMRENKRLDHIKQHPIKGFKLHWDLSKMSFAQAKFFQSFPFTRHLAELETIKGCQGVPCLYNKFVQDPSGEYGLLAWNFYLKTGIAVHGFDKRGLEQLWSLSTQLPPEFLHQSQLARMEVSELPEGQCYTIDGSTLRVASACVKAELGDKLVQRNLVSAMAYPFVESWFTPKSFAEYAWTGQSFSQTKVDNRSIAEAVGSYIVDHQTHEELTPVLAQNLFKRDWSLQGEMHRMFKKDQWVWRDIKSKHLKDCVDLHRSALVAPTQARGIAALADPHPLAQCLRSTAVSEFLKARRAWILNENPRNCEWAQPLDSGDVPVDAYISHWEKLVHKDIDQLEWRLRAEGPEWLADYQKKEATLSKFDPTWVYFECHKAPNAKGCYEQGLSSLVRAPAATQSEWLSEYPFEALEERVHEDVGLKRQWLLSQLTAGAEKSWNKCWSQGPNDLVKLSAPLHWVSPGATFVDGKFIACLEASSEKLIDQLLVRDTPETRYWRTELAAPLRQWWKERLDREARTEAQWLKQKSNEFKLSLKADLRRQISKGLGFSPKVECQKRLTYHYPTRLFFHTPQELNRTLGSELCQEVLKDQDLKELLTQYRQERWRVFSPALKSAMLERTTKLCRGRTVAQVSELDPVKGCVREQFDLFWPEVVGTVAAQHALPAENLEEFRTAVLIVTEKAFDP